jgi:Fe-S oxidoreductase
MGVGEKAIWYGMSAVSTALFAYGCWRLVARYRRGRAAGAPPVAWGRMLSVVLTHRWIARRSGVVGLAHAGVFYGFGVLFVGTMILSFDDHVASPLGFGFWHGWFYRLYSLFLDVFGAALLAGLVFFAARRAWGGVARLDYTRVDGRAVSAKRARYRLDDWVFLWTLLYLGATGFLLEALRIAVDRPSFEVWSPLGFAAGNLLRTLGVAGNGADTARAVVWWLHGVVALAFVAAIPFTKAMHMLTAPAAVGVRSDDVSRRLADEPETGYATLADFAPKHLLDLDACTKCGKCHDVCPARASGMPLSPRDLVLDLREASAAGFAGRLQGAGVAEEALWSCMSCNACVEICPVGIEHVPVINLLRRGLVEAGAMPTQLQTTLERIHTSGNSFGEPRRKRARWAKDAGLTLPDARKETVDVLWYVGDYASFDPRNQRSSVAFAELLQAAGVSVGVLHDGERTAGNDVRRAGEEGLFRMLAEGLIETLSGCDFGRIVTTDPHTFNTLRNEYPALGAPWSAAQVSHHTQLLCELLDAGSLAASEPLGLRGTYHDPCTLGRLNGIFDEPRRLISASGVELVEMPRNRDNSFCCGAGGGRIWMPETAPRGSRRPSEQRIDEAVALGDVDLFLVACPKDVVMYDDAIKTSGHQGTIELREVTRLLHEACGLADDTRVSVDEPSDRRPL